MDTDSVVSIVVFPATIPAIARPSQFCGRASRELLLLKFTSGDGQTVLLFFKVIPSFGSSVARARSRSVSLYLTCSAFSILLIPLATVARTATVGTRSGVAPASKVIAFKCYLL